MRWLAVVCVLLGCSHKKRAGGSSDAPKPPPLEVQLTTCAEALAELGEDTPAATVGDTLAPSCPTGCAAGCDSETGLRALAGWLAATRAKLGAGHVAVAALDAALVGFSVLLPPPTALPGTYRLPTSTHAVASDAWLLLTVGETEGWIAETARLTLAADGAAVTPTPAVAAPGQAIQLDASAGTSTLDAYLDHRLLGLEPGTSASGRSGIDSSAAPLLLADGQLPAQRVVDVAQVAAGYRVRLPVRIAVTGPTGQFGEHVLSVRSPTVAGARLELDRGGFRGDAGGALLPLAQLPGFLALLPPVAMRRPLVIDAVGQASVAELVQALDAIADAGFPEVALQQIDAHDGRGFGTFGRPRSPQPAVQLGQATVTGQLVRDEARRALRREASRLRYCYEKARLASPDLVGVLEVGFAVDAAGKTSAVKVSGFDATVAACIASVISRPEFKVPSGPGTVQLKLNFVVR